MAADEIVGADQAAQGQPEAASQNAPPEAIARGTALEQSGPLQDDELDACTDDGSSSPFTAPYFTEALQRPAVLEIPPDDGALAHALDGEAKEVARGALRMVLLRAEFEALKLVAWQFPRGMHIAAVPVKDTNPVEGRFPVTGLSARLKSTWEHHALYISAEEVVHKQPDGGVVGDTWVSFLSKYPHWRVVQRPSAPGHADEIVARARERIGRTERYSVMSENCEHFVCECYSGSASSQQVQDGTATALSATAAGGAAGAVAAVPMATTTVTSFAFGVIPWGTTTVVSGAVIGAGAAGGALVGAAVALPLWFAKRRVEQACSRRLPLGIINEGSRRLYVRAYSRNDEWCICPLKGAGGVGEGDVLADDLLELNPPDDADTFKIRIFEYAWGTDLVGAWSKEALPGTALVTRGSVYRLVLDDKDSVSLVRVPRGVLPAYQPGAATPTGGRGPLTPLNGHEHTI